MPVDYGPESFLMGLIKLFWEYFKNLDFFKHVVRTCLQDKIFNEAAIWNDFVNPAEPVSYWSLPKNSWLQKFSKIP